jgi:hypothetical protein
MSGLPLQGRVFQITATSRWLALASEKALELFTPIDERDYIGYNGSLGRKGYDDSVLAQYHIVDDPKRTATAQDADADPDEPVCLHETVEPYEDEPKRGACADCGADFDLTGAETDAQHT